MKNTLPDLFFFDALSSDAQVRAMGTVLKAQRNACADKFKEARRQIAANVNSCINDKYFLLRLKNEIKHLRSLESSDVKLVDNLKANFCKFHQDGTYHTFFTKRCEICHKGK